MIRVTIELDSALTGKTQLLGVMCIANEGTGTADSGNYTAAVLRKDRAHRVKQFVMPRTEDVLRTAKVLKYPRLSYNVWRLVMRALRGAFPEEGWDIHT